MKNEKYSHEIRRAADLIRSSKGVVALTGAGISTPSGIPDFRSPGSGLWEHYDPMKVASLNAFRYHPEQFFEWARPLAEKILSAEPNEAHFALARLEKAGFLSAVVTQNIDGLHFKAGSVHVLEIHGHLRHATCIRCFQEVSTENQLEAFVKRNVIPRCEHCGGILKPNIVLFGEQLPQQIVKEAKELFRQSSLILVIGSSLEVIPIALFPLEALNAGVRLIIINHEDTFLDERADVVIHHNLAEIVPALAEEVINERPIPKNT
jgi:NAD-dependent deacetylase